MLVHGTVLHCSVWNHITTVIKFNMYVCTWSNELMSSTYTEKYKDLEERTITFVHNVNVCTDRQNVTVFCFSSLLAHGWVIPSESAAQLLRARH